MVSALFALAADIPALGRVDRLTMSQQSLMEFVVVGTSIESLFKDPHSNFKDIEEWSGLTITEGLVKKLNWYPSHLYQDPQDGKLALRWLPDSVERIEVVRLGCELLETAARLQKVQISYAPVKIDFKTFSSGLQELILFQCRLEAGELRFADFPPSVRVLCISTIAGVENDVHGVADFSKAPQALEYLSLGHTNLTAILHLSKAPRKLREIKIYGNPMSGTFDLSGLPPHLEKLNLASNSLEGDVDLSRLPETLLSLDLHSNKITGPIDMSKLPRSLIWLNLAANRIAIPPVLENLPATLQSLSLENNGMCGTIDISEHVEYKKLVSQWSNGNDVIIVESDEI